MCENHTTTTEFFLLGFSGLRTFKGFLILLVFYVLTMSGNVIIVSLVVTSRSLHSPMYYFLMQLSISDIFLTTNIVPNTLHVLHDGGKTISFAGCLIQFYFFGAMESSECLILTVMAYDRYLAICLPLYYTTRMNNDVIMKLIVLTWFLSFSLILITTVTLSKLHFCGSNLVDHFFCDFTPLLELSHSDTTMIRLLVAVLSLPVIVLPLLLIVMSYIHIIYAILQISTEGGRWKAFSTCSSHLTVVFIFYGTMISIYVLPTKGISLHISKILSLLYTVVTPMLNPLIYSLRNEDMKEALKRSVRVIFM